MSTKVDNWSVGLNIFPHVNLETELKVTYDNDNLFITRGREIVGNKVVERLSSDSCAKPLNSFTHIILFSTLLLDKIDYIENYRLSFWLMQQILLTETMVVQQLPVISVNF